MTGTLENRVRCLLDGLDSRGISLQVRGDRLEVSPKSLLTDEDRVAIRELKKPLIRLIAPCVSHWDPSGWERQPVPDRPGWERADCRRCGRFMGFNPVPARRPQDSGNSFGIGMDSARSGTSHAAGAAMESY